jgi:hypothetical protein
VAAGRAASDEHALAAGLDGLKTAHAYLGHTGALATVLDELDPLLRHQGDLFRLQHAVFESAFVPLAAGDWTRATAAMESAIEINRRSGYPHWPATFVAHLGRLARLLGRDHDAVSFGRRALQLSQANDHPWATALACAELGITRMAAGSPAEAIELFERGHAAAEKHGAEAYLLHCLGPLAEATRSPSVLAEADRLLADARLPAGDAWVLGYEVYLSVARAWLTARQPERARAVLARCLVWRSGCRGWPHSRRPWWWTVRRLASSARPCRRGRRWPGAPPWPGRTAWFMFCATRIPWRARSDELGQAGSGAGGPVRSRRPVTECGSQNSSPKNPAKAPPVPQPVVPGYLSPSLPRCPGSRQGHRRPGALMAPPCSWLMHQS